MSRQRRVVITGGPGAGKTTLLAELARIGHETVEESARSIIVERLAHGYSPRPDPLAFAKEILRRDVEKFHQRQHGPGWVFFDRCAVEALAMVHEASPLPLEELEIQLSTSRYHPVVFVLPPWHEIYVTDSERDQSFAEAVIVHHKITEWYSACGYTIREVPRVTVSQRAAYALAALDTRVV